MRKNKMYKYLFLALVASVALGACTSDKKPPMKGDRIAILDVRDNSDKEDKTDSTTMTLAAERDNSAWPQPNGNASHTPQNLGLNTGKLKEAWSASIGDGSEKDRKLITAPIAVNGKVFVANTEGKVSAFTLDKGKKLWEVNILPKDDDSVTVSAGLTYSNNILYVTDNIGHILALNAEDGKKIWGVGVDQSVRGAPTVQDGRLFLITLDDETIALDALTGETLWRNKGVQESASLLGTPNPAVDGSVVITAYSSGDIVALRAETGQEAWSDNLTGIAEFQSRAVTQLAGFRSNPVLDQSVVFVGNASSRTIAIHVPSGERIWQKEFGLMATPWSSGNVVFAVTSLNELVALSKENGHTRWTLPLAKYEDPDDKEDPIFWTGPVLAGGRLFIASSHEQMLEVEPETGKIIRKTELPGRVMLAPIVVERSLVVLTDNGRLVVYK